MGRTGDVDVCCIIFLFWYSSLFTVFKLISWTQLLLSLKCQHFWAHFIYSPCIESGPAIDTFFSVNTSTGTYLLHMLSLHGFNVFCLCERKKLQVVIPHRTFLPTFYPPTYLRSSSKKRIISKIVMLFHQLLHHRCIREAKSCSIPIFYPSSWINPSVPYLPYHCIVDVLEIFDSNWY